ncbi:hypothetical protein [Staphylospora marina]|nr:hypothetical protein [Staphylospora marina]
MIQVTKDGTVTTNLIPGEAYKVTFGNSVREITAPAKPTTITFVVTQP